VQSDLPGSSTDAAVLRCCGAAVAIAIPAAPLVTQAGPWDARRSMDAHILYSTALAGVFQPAVQGQAGSRHPAAPHTCSGRRPGSQTTMFVPLPAGWRHRCSSHWSALGPSCSAQQAKLPCLVSPRQVLSLPLEVMLKRGLSISLPLPATGFLNSYGQERCMNRHLDQ